MIPFLVLLCLALGIGLGLIAKQLKQIQDEYSVAQQKFKEAGKKLQMLEQKYALTSNQLKQTQDEYLIEKNKVEQTRNDLEDLTQKLTLMSNQFEETKSAYLIKQKDLEESTEKLQSLQKKYGGLIIRDESIKSLDTQIRALTDRLEDLNKKSALEEAELSDKIFHLQEKLKLLEEQDFLEEFGFYESKYDFQEASEYKKKLDEIRAKQKQMIKDGTAAICHTTWFVAGSRKEGQKMTDDFLKLVLRAFNGECDAAVMKVKYNNVQTMENRIRKTFADLNKLSKTTNSQINSDYFDLKLKELWLTHEYQEKRYLEQEEQRIIREQMREEERALRELEKAKQEAEREEKRYQDALEKARKDIENVTGEAQAILQKQIEDLQRRLLEAEANKERAISQAQITKSGYVYIISNIGSFGQDVYKIGMTRRLEPMDRVKELGDASVPFPFDVHAMVFCENAPELELRLHQWFNERRVNKVNNKKEFFRISLDEIVRAVHEIDEELKICKSEIRITRLAEASEFRKTLAKERNVI